MSMTIQTIQSAEASQTSNALQRHRAQKQRAASRAYCQAQRLVEWSTVLLLVTLVLFMLSGDTGDSDIGAAALARIIELGVGAFVLSLGWEKWMRARFEHASCELRRVC